jgi:hypothetical protein
MTRQEAVTHKDAIFAFINGAKIEMQGPGETKWAPCEGPTWLLHWKYRVVNRVTINVEDLIENCVPGGYSCDPQAVADDIRSYCNRKGVPV